MLQKVNVYSAIYWNSTPIPISFKKIKIIYAQTYTEMNMKTNLKATTP